MFCPIDAEPGNDLVVAFSPIREDTVSSFLSSRRKTFNLLIPIPYCSVKLFKVLLVGLLGSLSVTSTAYAYIDPGSGTLLWQLMLSAFFGGLFFIYRLRLWVLGKINFVLERLRRKQ